MSESHARETGYAAFFNLYQYLGYRGAQEGESLREILYKISKDSYYSQKDSYKILADAIKRYPDLGDAVIKGQSWNEKKYNSETNACIFEMKSGDIYVAYQGTEDGGWIDNGQGMTQQSTMQQREASRYFDDMAEKYGWTEEDYIVITGHSKGGNKAQYVTLMADNHSLIDICYSMDGQGFSDEAIKMFREKYGDEAYLEILKKMYGVNGNNDYVNPLGHTIIPKENIIYLETTTDSNWGIGDAYAGYHELEKFFKREDGEYIAELTPSGKRGEMGELSAQLSEYLMNLPIEEREATAMTIMQLMESVTGGSHVGLDQDSLTADQLLTFTSKDLIPVMVELVKSEEGRKILSDLLRRFVNENPELAQKLIPVVIILSPVIVAAVLGVVGFASLLKEIKEMLEKLGRLYERAVEAFVKFMDFISDIGEGLKEWLNNLRPSADYSRFKVDLSVMNRMESNLRKQHRDLEYIAQQVRQIRKNVDFGLLIRQALYFNLTASARHIEDNAAAIEEMGQVLERCREYYGKNEMKVVSRYER